MYTPLVNITVQQTTLKLEGLKQNPFYYAPWFCGSQTNTKHMSENRLALYLSGPSNWKTWKLRANSEGLTASSCPSLQSLIFLNILQVLFLRILDFTPSSIWSLLLGDFNLLLQLMAPQIYIWSTFFFHEFHSFIQQIS